jgi:hypothetical protein
MTTDSTFALLCGGLIALLFGLTVAFAGYRLVFILLPIWGFFFGLWLGAQSMQALLGTGFLATTTSWIVGFLVGAVFAVLSYLFYFMAVALIAGALGYLVATGVLLWIGLSMNFITWLIGIVAAVVLAFVTIRFNLQKWVIIVATSFMGAGMIVVTFALMFNPALKLLENPLTFVLKTDTLSLLLFLVIGIVAVVVQVMHNRSYSVLEYNRWEEMGTTTTTM